MFTRYARDLGDIMYGECVGCFLLQDLPRLADALAAVAADRHQLAQLLHGARMILANRTADRFIRNRITQANVHNELTRLLLYLV